MDGEHYLILIKNKDRTSDVASYEAAGHLIQMIYRGSSKPYHFKASDVMILTNPVVIVIAKEQFVSYKGSGLNNVVRVLDFGPRIRVFLGMERRGCTKQSIFESKAVV